MTPKWPTTASNVSAANRWRAASSAMATDATLAAPAALARCRPTASISIDASTPIAAAAI